METKQTLINDCNKLLEHLKYMHFEKVSASPLFLCFIIRDNNKDFSSGFEAFLKDELSAIDTKYPELLEATNFTCYASYYKVIAKLIEEAEIGVWQRDDYHNRETFILKMIESLNQPNNETV